MRSLSSLFAALVPWMVVTAYAEEPRSIAIQNDSGTKVEIYWIPPVSKPCQSFISVGC
jgi:hypothetical protein